MKKIILALVFVVLTVSASTIFWWEPTDSSLYRINVYNAVNGKLSHVWWETNWFVEVEVMMASEPSGHYLINIQTVTNSGPNKYVPDGKLNETNSLYWVNPDEPRRPSAPTGLMIVQ
jgi:hypothetical protein